MVGDMSQLLTFSCKGATLAGTLHPAPGTTAVLIVTGGLQTRHGSHRGLVTLGDRLAGAGYPVLRFDRRGVGDSDGEDPGFHASGPDISAAWEALRQACPQVTHVVGWGLCDGATALAIQPDGFDGLILANPWLLDRDRADPLPPSPAIAVHYAEQVTSLRAWWRLLTGGVSLRTLGRGITKLAKPAQQSATAMAMSCGLDSFKGKILVLLSDRDSTAQAFAAALSGLCRHRPTSDDHHDQWRDAHISRH
jgi:exosortase A-associated hydrolase 1